MPSGREARDASRQAADIASIERRAIGREDRGGTFPIQPGARDMGLVDHGAQRLLAAIGEGDETRRRPVLGSKGDRAAGRASTL